MKIIVNSLELNDAISKVTRALPTRDVVPVLECIKIVANDDKMTLYATDKDLAIERTIEANVIVGGATLVPGKVFGDYIRNIATGEGDISLEVTDNNRLRISTSGSECNLSTMDVEDYPEAENIEGEGYFAIQEINLKEIINNVIFSVATDDSRPMLRGVYFETNEYALTAVATDGYRFSMSKKALEEKSERISATVPAKSLSELARLLGDSEDVLKVYVTKDYMQIVFDNTKLLTRLLSGNYIRYDNIIPKDFVSSLLVNKSNLERSLNTASIMSRGDKNNLVELDIEEYNMHISSTSQYGTAKENVSISLSGKDVRCAYNAKYINDCLKVINADTIKMEFAQHSSCVITINNSDEVMYFILPVKQII